MCGGGADWLQSWWKASGWWLLKLANILAALSWSVTLCHQEGLSFSGFIHSGPFGSKMMSTLNLNPSLSPRGLAMPSGSEKKDGVLRLCIGHLEAELLRESSGNQPLCVGLL